MKAECQAWADTEGAPCPARPWLSLVPQEGELVIHARPTWGLQHALVDLTVTVFTRGPSVRSFVILPRQEFEWGSLQGWSGVDREPSHPCSQTELSWLPAATSL